MTVSTADVYFILPKEATNLITNPSFELGTTGYAAVGAGVSVARVTTQQRRGLASLEITTATGVISGAAYTIALTNGTQYSFSADVRDVAGQTFNLYITNAGGTRVSDNVTWTGTGQWKRRSVTYTAAASANHMLVITRSAVASTTKFYTDGWQLETGEVSTYLDGDMSGFVTGQQAYRWNGTPHASTSWRSGQTRSGGTYMRLSDYAKAITILGLGLSPMVNTALPTSLGGSHYQNTTAASERPFTIMAHLTGGGDYGVIQAKRAALINAVKPDATTYRQPLLIEYVERDSAGVEVSERLQVPALYVSGLEGGEKTAWNERIAMSFTSYLPLMYQEGEKSIALGFKGTINDTTGMFMRDATGTWSSFGYVPGVGTSASGAIIVGPDGKVYSGGRNGAAWGQVWDGASWTTMGSGANGVINAFAFGPDGALYAGGNFTSAGGVANTARIAKWNGSAWSALGTGAPDGEVRALHFHSSGVLIMGGTFTSVGGVANTAKIAKWDGSTWIAMSTGANDAVNIIAEDKNTTVFAGGDFTTIGGVSINRIAKWDGSAWSAVGSASGADGVVYALALGLDGTMFMGGDFTSVAGQSITNFAAWTGSDWYQPGGLAPDIPGSGVVRKLLVAPDGSVYVGGRFNRIGTTMAARGIAQYFNGTWQPLDIDTDPGYDGIALDKAGRLFLVNYYPVPRTVTVGVATAANSGSGTAYPKFILTGPGSINQIKNFTTGKAIFFNTLTLFDGETITIDTNPMRFTFTSNFRGNLMNYILPGSSMNFELLPGANNISAYIYGTTTAATTIYMTWRDGYWSVDGAVR